MTNPDLRPGESSEWVLYLQQLLNHHYQQTVVPESGEFDDTTAGAVSHFREQNGFSSGSTVDSSVWDRLTGDSTPAAQPAGDGGSGGGTVADPVAGVHDADAGAGGAPGWRDTGAEGASGSDDQPEQQTSTDRGLTGDEVAAAFSVFQGTLDTSSIVLSEGGIMAVGGYARTLPDHVTFPDGTLTNPPASFMPWLIHELGHCWQYQQGASVPGLIMSALGGDYDYGGEQGLRDAAAAGTPFSDFGYEEQAEIFADYYRHLGGDTSAYDPYIRSVHEGTWQSAPQTP